MVGWQAGASSTPTRSCRSSSTRMRHRLRSASRAWLCSTGRSHRCSGWTPDALDGPDGAAIFAGNALPDGARPIAQAYAGHQFGHFTVLGDGRAILLGEQSRRPAIASTSSSKAPGRRRFSRRGDGRAALGPMLREYIISEAMHALGIPTTRSLAVAATGEPVFRETVLHGAVLTRVAASHIRVGTVQWAAAHDDHGALRALADYTVHGITPRSPRVHERYLALFEAILARQARLIARWQLVGFIHGVMNTDNMALSGETIDYGPCAFMDAYDPATVFSSIDHGGRYAYGNQPASRSGTSHAWPRRCCRCSTRTPIAPRSVRPRRSVASRVYSSSTGSAACGRNWGCSRRSPKIRPS